MAVILALEEQTEVATEISKRLKERCFIISKKKFPDGEFSFFNVPQLQNETVFFIASLHMPSANVLDVLMMLGEVKQRMPSRFVLVLVYAAFSRQDKRKSSDESQLSGVMIDMLCSFGITDVILIDIHDKEAEKYFSKQGVNVTNFSFLEAIINEVVRNFGEDLILVAPDKGSAGVVDRCAKLSGLKSLVVPKTRDENGVISRDHSEDFYDKISDKSVLIVDDMIDTAGTIVSLADLFKGSGVKKVSVVATHALLSGPAESRLKESCIESIVVSDSLPLSTSVARTLKKKLIVISLNDGLTNAIKRCVCTK